MASHPTAAELVQAVRIFLAETARPQLTGRAAFHARVAENALAIVERELTAGAALSTAATARLQQLLHDASQDKEALDRQLCEAIRAGRIDWNSEGLLEHLKATAIDQLRIDQPKYSGLAIATESA